MRAKCVENVANCEMPLTLKAEAFKKCNEYYEEKDKKRLISDHYSWSSDDSAFNLSK